MKHTLFYLAGTLIGIALGVFLPLVGGDSLEVLQQLTEIVIRVGRFLLFPMAFFAVIIAIDELRDERRLKPVLLRTAIGVVATVVFAAIIGAVSVTLLRPQRIPPMVQEAVVSSPASISAIVEASIPRNGFQVFTLGDNAFAMILLLAAAVGWMLRYDREITSPVSLVADSANRILYRLNTRLGQIVGLLLSIPVGTVIVTLRLTDDVALFVQLLIVVATTALVVGVVIYPAVLYLAHGDVEHIGRWLRGMVVPSLSAIATGDVYFATNAAARSNNDDLAIPRRIGGSVSYFVAVFSRSGTVLVAIASFLVVLRSYTALEIGFGETISIMLTGVGASVLLGRTPAGAVTLVLSYLALAYGRGMAESYLILLPVLPILERIGAWLDVMTHGFVSFYVAEDTHIVR